MKTWPKDKGALVDLADILDPLVETFSKFLEIAKPSIEQHGNLVQLYEKLNGYPLTDPAIHHEIMMSNRWIGEHGIIMSLAHIAFSLGVEYGKRDYISKHREFFGLAIGAMKATNDAEARVGMLDLLAGYLRIVGLIQQESLKESE